MPDHFPGIDTPEDENADLKNRVARLEAAREHDRAEIAALQKAILSDQVNVRRAVETLGKDFELTRDAIDARVHQLAESDSTVAQAVGGVVGEVAADVLGLMKREAAAVLTLADSQIAILERLEAIERLVGPALAGRVKLMAQEV